jgi:hypothetical protein
MRTKSHMNYVRVMGATIHAISRNPLPRYAPVTLRNQRFYPRSATVSGELLRVEGRLDTLSCRKPKWWWRRQIMLLRQISNPAIQHAANAARLSDQLLKQLRVLIKQFEQVHHRWQGNGLAAFVA